METIERSFESGMHLRQAGRGEEGAILYVHGLGESALGFERVMTAGPLAGWLHLAPDLGGYGKSLWPDPARSLEEHAAALGRRLVESGVGPVVVLGHSMGGVIGQLLAEREPERVRGFVNVEGNVSFADCTFSSRGAAHGLESFLDRGFAELLDGVYRGGVDDPALRTYFASLRICDPRAFHRNSVELVELSRREELAGRMAALGVPAVYLYGDPRGTGERSRELLAAAGVETRPIEGAGHWPFLDQPEAFVRELAGFLERL